jgi:hypothetical protein
MSRSRDDNLELKQLIKEGRLYAEAKRKAVRGRHTILSRFTAEKAITHHFSVSSEEKDKQCYVYCWSRIAASWPRP